MATYQEAAETAFCKAREFYTGEEINADGKKLSLPGKMKYKSSNKWCNNKREKSVEKARRNEADSIIGLHRKNRLYGIDDGLVLFHSETSAANCGELAGLASYFAWERLGGGRPRRDIAIVSLKAPGDHALCVVGEPDSIEKLKGTKIDDVSNIVTYQDDLWAIDPWLNICSTMKNYPVMAEAKFKKWNGDGKRIWWKGLSGNAPGWYSPQGDYANGFLAGVMDFFYATC